MALQSISHWGMFDLPEAPVFPFRNLWTGDIVDPDVPGAFDHPLEAQLRALTRAAEDKIDLMRGRRE